MAWPCTQRSAISSRSANERERPESGFADGLNIAGGRPPAFRNHRVPTAGGTSAAAAASSLARPAAIAGQNRRRSSRPATGGRPGDRNGARPARSDRRFRLSIATASVKVLRRPLESARYTSGSAKRGVAGVYNRALYLCERRKALKRWAEHVSALSQE